MSTDKKSVFVDAKRVIGMQCNQLSNLFHCSIYATLCFVGLFHSNAGKNVIYNFS
jgi:hypothetical protein